MDENNAFTAFNLWERACSRRGPDIQLLRWLIYRYREQAHSYIGSVVDEKSAFTPFNL